jgi:hypothetical protein
MQNPVVAMTPEQYFQNWAVAFAIAAPIFFAALYVVIRLAVAHAQADWIRHEESRK